MASVKTELIDTFREKYLALQNKVVSEKATNTTEFNKLGHAALKAIRLEREKREFFGVKFWVKRVVKYSIAVAVILFIVLFGAYMCIAYSPRASRYVVREIHDRDILYYISRAIRKLAIPLHSLFNLEAAYRWECLIDNPFYVTELPTCSQCTDIDGVAVNHVNKSNGESDMNEPQIVYGDPYYSNNLVPYSSLRSLITHNRDTFARGVCKTYSFTHGSDVDVIDAVVRRDYNELITGNYSFGWLSCDASPARLLRQLFPRPHLVPGRTEIALEKYLFFTSPFAPAIKLPDFAFDYTVIIQVSGQSNFVLKPLPHCSVECREVQFRLNTGEMFVTLTGTPWSVSVQAIGKELGILHILQCT